MTTNRTRSQTLRVLETLRVSTRRVSNFRVFALVLATAMAAAMAAPVAGQPPPPSDFRPAYGASDLQPSPPSDIQLLTSDLQDVALPRFEPERCWFALPAGAIEGTDLVCGWLVVPEEHDVQGTPTLRLAVAVLRARGFTAEPEPVVFVPSRPGAGGLDQLVPLQYANPLRDTRDLIVYDPRGTGHSQPALDCPEVRAEVLAQLAEPPSAEEAAARHNAAALACRQRLVQGGINLSAYNTLEAAADLDDLRRALGYPQLNLYALGYGTRVATAAARNYPTGMRGVVLDGVLPPEQNALTDAPRIADGGFTEYFAACVALARCSVWYRDLERNVSLLVDQFNARPARLNVTDPVSGQSHPVALTGDAFTGHLVNLIARTDALPILPELVRRTSAGQYGPLENYLSAAAFDPSFADGAYWSAVCAEDGAVNPGPPNVGDLRRWVQWQVVAIQAAYALCDEWRVRALPAADPSPEAELGADEDLGSAPAPSDVPALILNGNFDPLTPAGNGAVAAAWFRQATAVTFINSSHGSYPSSGECAIGLVEDFYETPGLALDTECVETTPPVAFVIPSEVVDMPARTLLRDIRTQQPRTLVWLAALSLATAVLLTSLILFPMRWLFSRREPPPELQAALPTEIPAGMPAMPAMTPPQFDPSQAGAVLPKAAPWLAVLAGLSLVAMAVLLPLVVDPVIAAGAPITWIGLPVNLAWFAALPVVMGVLTLLLLIASVAGWLGKDWSGRRKVYLGVLVLAAIAAFVLLIGAGALAPAWVWGTAWVRGMLGF